MQIFITLKIILQYACIALSIFLLGTLFLFQLKYPTVRIKMMQFQLSNTNSAYYPRGRQNNIFLRPAPGSVNFKCIFNIIRSRSSLVGLVGTRLNILKFLY